jgi:hypothetical protein
VSLDSNLTYQQQVDFAWFVRDLVGINTGDRFEDNILAHHYAKSIFEHLGISATFYTDPDE